MFTDILTLLKKVNRQIWELSNKCIDILFFEIKIYEIVFEETMYYKQQFIVSNSVTQAMLPKLEILFLWHWNDFWGTLGNEITRNVYCKEKKFQKDLNNKSPKAFTT